MGLPAEKKSISAVVPPQGGKIFSDTITIDMSKTWKEAVDAAVSKVPMFSVVRGGSVSWYYQPASFSSSKELKHVVLVNFGRVISGSDAPLSWGKQSGLSPANPRIIFSLSENNPDLNNILGFEEMTIFSTVPCEFFACDYFPGIFWKNGLRKANMETCFDSFEENAWFAFTA